MNLDKIIEYLKKMRTELDISENTRIIVDRKNTELIMENQKLRVKLAAIDAQDAR